MTTESKQFPKELQEEFSEIFGRDHGPPLQIQVSLRQTHNLVGGIHQTDVLAYPTCVIKPCFIAQIQARNLKNPSLYCSTKWLANNCMAHSCTSHHAHLYPQAKSLLIFGSSVREVFKVINHTEHSDSFFLIEFSFLYFWELFSHLCKINKTINPGLKDNTRNLAVIK